MAVYIRINSGKEIRINRVLPVELELWNLAAIIYTTGSIRAGKNLL